MRAYILLCLTSLLIGCRAGKTVEDGSTDTAIGVADDGDEDVPEDLAPVHPVGSWYDCKGRLDLHASGRWDWVDVGSGCTVGGSLLAESDALVVLQAPDDNTCSDELPWWIPSATEDARYNHAQSASRLTLVPETAEGASGSTSTTEKHFYTDLERSRWLFENQDGEQTHFDACFSAEGVFFEGGYAAIDGSCNFLSCAGAIHEWREVDAAVQIWTGCSGDCPCSGLLVTDTMTATTLSGSYRGSNCARVFEGTFDATRIDFPTGDSTGR